MNYVVYILLNSVCRREQGRSPTFTGNCEIVWKMGIEMREGLDHSVAFQVSLFYFTNILGLSDLEVVFNI